MILAAGLAASGAWGAGVADAPSFSRYAVILERQPFGVAPPAAAAAAPTGPAAADSFVSHVRLTALMQEEGGAVRVGFVDRAQKDKAYMLGVGESEDDYQVLEADLEAELARIRKGSEEQWLSLKAPGAAAPPVRAAAEAASPQPVRLSEIRPGPTASPLAPVRAPLPNLAGLRRASRYAAIRRAELEREKLEAEARKRGVWHEPPADGDDGADETPVAGITLPASDGGDDEDDGADEADEGDDVEISADGWDDEDDDDGDEAVDDEEVVREAEIQAHLQNYQKELIRQGLPPLPVPLTPKTDRELVAEGVLPALPPPPPGEDETE